MKNSSRNHGQRGVRDIAIVAIVALVVLACINKIDSPKFLIALMALVLGVIWGPSALRAILNLWK